VRSQHPDATFGISTSERGSCGCGVAKRRSEAEVPSMINFAVAQFGTISEYIAYWLKWAAEDIARYP
jgi:hypothetical protein